MVSFSRKNEQTVDPSEIRVIYKNENHRLGFIQSVNES